MLNVGSPVRLWHMRREARAVSPIALDSEAPSPGWPVWAGAVDEALRRRNTSVNAAATYLGVRNTTLKKWLDGVVPPQLSLLPKFAELTGLSHAIQLELAGVLPPTMRADAHAIQVADELRSVLGSVTEIVARASELAFSDAGARLAGILLSEGQSDLQITLRRAYRGRRFPIHLSTYVGLESIARGEPGDDDEAEEALRRRVTRIVGESASAFGARWREQDPHDWRPPRPRLILNIPQHERPRPPSAAPLSAVPNLLMLGCPYGHAEYIGALLADALGYGYLDVRYSVPLPLDLAPTDPTVTAARTEFTKGLVNDEQSTRKHVWSVTDHRVLPAVVDSLAEANVACTVYIRSDDCLLNRGSQVWGVPVDEMHRLRTMLDQLTKNAPWPVLTVSLPDELLSDEMGGNVDRDRIADVAMLAAVDVWRYLGNYGFVPRANTARGRLRSMFDDHGRPKGDPRPLLVTEALRMPPRH